MILRILKKCQRMAFWEILGAIKKTWVYRPFFLENWRGGAAFFYYLLFFSCNLYKTWLSINKVYGGWKYPAKTQKQHGIIWTIYTIALWCIHKQNTKNKPKKVFKPVENYYRCRRIQMFLYLEGVLERRHLYSLQWLLLSFAWNIRI